MEEVYEKLGQILDDVEDGDQGPRSAAVAKFAHGVLKVSLLKLIL